MKIAGAIFGFIILAVIFVVWIRAYKSIKGEDNPLFSGGKRKPGEEKDSLEDFIASYKRGEVRIPASVPTAAKPASAPPPLPAAAAAAVAAAAAAAAPAAPVRRESFISGATKLAYLTCKAGLRDHHVFANVQLSALSTGGMIDPALARSGVDLLVCNTAMSAVVAIDLIDAGSGAANVAKSDHLKTLGIRYLRLSAKSLPRPTSGTPCSTRCKKRPRIAAFFGRGTKPQPFLAASGSAGFSLGCTSVGCGIALSSGGQNASIASLWHQWALKPSFFLMHS